MTHFYSAESVTDGHPDKLCDQIADTVPDGCLTLDRNARVACEVLATKGHIVLAGEISTTVMPDLGKLTREALENAGYNPKDFEIESLIHPQSPDIEAVVNDPLDAESDPNAIGAGDQCVVVGYATDETPEMLPLPVVLAHRLTSRLTWARINDEQKRFGPDGKAMAIVEYERPVRVARIVVSFQHAPEVDPTDLTELIWRDVILSALKGMPYDDSLELILNPGGHFVLGGPDADTGLTGRKLAVDAYGPFVPTGGGAFSGKDPTKLDRSGAYMARCIAKNLVTSRFARRCQVTLTYAIGMAKPLAVEVDTFGTGLLCEDDCLAAAVQSAFDLTPAGIITELDLQRPIYARTAVGGHFGRDDLPWERLDRTGLLMATIR
ncbi:methionine adenosyltransferase [Mediterraneibacter glycyrrhizinilyticus]|uniref:methionine adenosyltransferase n=1 Tax=Mediterraneibacter glycyrrhizinilyticus TaxID=342942 RepID=UPI0025A3DF81|nr:methionine adenosyltransferase [Mediterraneibacter glycyrrhizinilyticus]MDM8125287.1 methionine adenosyltransferase [Mediterraneibacter glycyrrhizinilyticus]